METETKTLLMTNIEAMQGLKNGLFEGNLIEISTDDFGVTTITITTEVE
jgi:hypothetical protein